MENKTYKNSWIAGLTLSLFLVSTVLGPLTPLWADGNSQLDTFDSSQRETSVNAPPQTPPAPPNLPNALSSDSAGQVPPFNPLTQVNLAEAAAIERLEKTTVTIYENGTPRSCPPNLSGCKEMSSALYSIVPPTVLPNGQRRFDGQRQYKQINLAYYDLGRVEVYGVPQKATDEQAFTAATFDILRRDGETAALLRAQGLISYISALKYKQVKIEITPIPESRPSDDDSSVALFRYALKITVGDLSLTATGERKDVRGEPFSQYSVGNIQTASRFAVSSGSQNESADQTTIDQLTGNLNSLTSNLNNLTSLIGKVAGQALQALLNAIDKLTQAINHMAQEIQKLIEKVIPPLPAVAIINFSANQTEGSTVKFKAEIQNVPNGGKVYVALKDSPANPRLILMSLVSANSYAVSSHVSIGAWPYHIEVRDVHGNVLKQSDSSEVGVSGWDPVIPEIVIKAPSAHVAGTTAIVSVIVENKPADAEVWLNIPVNCPLGAPCVNPAPVQRFEMTCTRANECSAKRENLNPGTYSYYITVEHYPVEQVERIVPPLFNPNELKRSEKNRFIIEKPSPPTQSFRTLEEGLAAVESKNLNRTISAKEIRVYDTFRVGENPCIDVVEGPSCLASLAAYDPPRPQYSVLINPSATQRSYREATNVTQNQDGTWSVNANNLSQEMGRRTAFAAAFADNQGFEFKNVKLTRIELIPSAVRSLLQQENYKLSFRVTRHIGPPLGRGPDQLINYTADGTRTMITGRWNYQFRNISQIQPPTPPTQSFRTVEEAVAKLEGVTADRITVYQVWGMLDRRLDPADTFPSDRKASDNNIFYSILSADGKSREYREADYLIHGLTEDRWAFSKKAVSKEADVKLAFMAEAYHLLKDNPSILVGHWPVNFEGVKLTKIMQFVADTFTGGPQPETFSLEYQVSSCPSNPMIGAPCLQTIANALGTRDKTTGKWRYEVKFQPQTPPDDQQIIKLKRILASLGPNGKVVDPDLNNITRQGQQTQFELKAVATGKATLQFGYDFCAKSGPVKCMAPARGKEFTIEVKDPPPGARYPGSQTIKIDSAFFTRGAPESITVYRGTTVVFQLTDEQVFFLWRASESADREPPDSQWVRMDEPEMVAGVCVVGADSPCNGLQYGGSLWKKFYRDKASQVELANLVIQYLPNFAKHFKLSEMINDSAKLERVMPGLLSSLLQLNRKKPGYLHPRIRELLTTPAVEPQPFTPPNELQIQGGGDVPAGQLILNRGTRTATIRTRNGDTYTYSHLFESINRTDPNMPEGNGILGTYVNGTNQTVSISGHQDRIDHPDGSFELTFHHHGVAVQFNRQRQITDITVFHESLIETVSQDPEKALTMIEKIRAAAQDEAPAAELRLILAFLNQQSAIAWENLPSGDERVVKLKNVLASLGPNGKVVDPDLDGIIHQAKQIQFGLDVVGSSGNAILTFVNDICGGNRMCMAPAQLKKLTLNVQDPPPGADLQNPRIITIDSAFFRTGPTTLTVYRGTTVIFQLTDEQFFSLSSASESTPTIVPRTPPANPTPPAQEQSTTVRATDVVLVTVVPCPAKPGYSAGYCVSGNDWKHQPFDSSQALPAGFKGIGQFGVLHTNMQTLGSLTVTDVGGKYGLRREWVVGYEKISLGNGKFQYKVYFKSPFARATPSTPVANTPAPNPVPSPAAPSPVPQPEPVPSTPAPTQNIAFQNITIRGTAPPRSAKSPNGRFEVSVVNATSTRPQMTLLDRETGQSQAVQFSALSYEKLQSFAVDDEGNIYAATVARIGEITAYANEEAHTYVIPAGGRASQLRQGSRFSSWTVNRLTDGDNGVISNGMISIELSAIGGRRMTVLLFAAVQSRQPEEQPQPTPQPQPRPSIPQQPQPTSPVQTNTPAVSIGGVQITNTTERTTVVSAQINNLASGQRAEVRYRIKFDGTRMPQNWSAIGLYDPNNPPTGNFKVTIPGLEAGQTYEYQVVVVKGYETIASSPIQTFKTLTPKPPREIRDEIVITQETKVREVATLNLYDDVIAQNGDFRGGSRNIMRIDDNGFPTRAAEWYVDRPDNLDGGNDDWPLINAGVIRGGAAYKETRQDILDRLRRAGVGDPSKPYYFTGGILSGDGVHRSGTIYYFQITVTTSTNDGKGVLLGEDPIAREWQQKEDQIASNRAEEDAQRKNDRMQRANQEDSNIVALGRAQGLTSQQINALLAQAREARERTWFAEDQQRLNQREAEDRQRLQASQLSPQQKEEKIVSNRAKYDAQRKNDRMQRANQEDSNIVALGRAQGLTSQQINALLAQAREARERTWFAEDQQRLNQRAAEDRQR